MWGGLNPLWLVGEDEMEETYQAAILRRLLMARILGGGIVIRHGGHDSDDDMLALDDYEIRNMQVRKVISNPSTLICIRKSSISR